MINTHTLFTSEVDIPDIAVSDIRQQLAQISLCKNTVGIIACHYDHVECGVIAALQQALPFPIIGCTTFYKATPAASGLFELTITILTSDDVSFAQSASDDSRDYFDPATKIRQTYDTAFKANAQKPALILSFISANRPVTGDEYLRILDDASGGVPTFGVVDSGEDETGANTYIIGDGKAFSDGMAMLLLIGDIDAKMYVSSPLADRLLSFSATVTSAQGVSVREINGQPATAYLKKNSIDIDEAKDTILTSMPFYFHKPGIGQFVSRLVKSVPDDGSLEFMAEIPEGALLRIGTVTAEDILEESGNAIRTAVAENPEASFFFIASCVGRFITLGLDTTSEIDHITNNIPSGKNYLACYAGGEICPISKDSTLMNCYHNNSLVVLALC